MAKVVGVDTQIRGKLGARIYQVLNGEQIVKTFAIPSNPDTAGQQAQRGVFADIIATFKAIAANVIAVFWDPFTVSNKTGWGNFISKNLLSMGKVAFDITDAVISYGSLEQLGTVSATYDTSTGSAVLTGEKPVLINGALADPVHAIAVDTPTGVIIGKSLDLATREDEGETLPCSAGYTATDVEFFVWASQYETTTEDIGLVSTSQNDTCTAPA